MKLHLSKQHEIIVRVPIRSSQCTLLLLILVIVKISIKVAQPYSRAVMTSQLLHMNNLDIRNVNKIKCVNEIV